MTPVATRAAAFADGVRRRVAARTRGGGGVRMRPASAVERVLRTGGRALRARPVREARIDVRVSLAFGLAAAEGRARVVDPREATWPARVAQTGSPRPAAPVRPAVGRCERDTSLQGGARHAPPAEAAARTPRTPLLRMPVVLAPQRDAAATPGAAAPLVGPAARSVAAPVVLVHRAPSPVAAAGPVPLGAVGAGGMGGISVGPAALPLTAADLPRVVERVVGEIDRRVTAARERRGWTA